MQYTKSFKDESAVDDAAAKKKHHHKHHPRADVDESEDVCIV